MPEDLSERWISDLLRRLRAGPVPPRDTAALQRYATGYIEQRVGWLDDLGFATQLLTELRIPGRSATDFRHQRVAAGGEIGLAGIRFLNGDPDKPFIDLEASTGRVTSQMCRAAFDAFDMFGPRSVRYHLPGIQPPRLGDGWCPTADQHVVVGYLSDLVPRDGSVTLKNADPVEAERWLPQAYAGFPFRSASLAARVAMSDAEQLNDCATTGRLCWWQIEGQRVGLIGVSRTLDHGFDGYLMTEQVVDSPFVGRGSAAVAQGKLITSLRTENPDVALFGTIDASNTPSLRTAAANGRVIHGTKWFLTPSETC